MGNVFVWSNYQVMEGRTDEFVERWTDLINWTRETQAGLVAARLLANDESPLVMMSAWTEWRDVAARQACLDTPRFVELGMSLIELCDDRKTSSYEVKSSV